MRAAPTEIQDLTTPLTTPNRAGMRGAPERTAVVFQRPLPYLYLARSVFADAGQPYQALDSLPLAAEPRGDG